MAHGTALVATLEHAGIEGETFNIGAGEERDVRTVGEAVLRILGKPESLLRSVQDRPGNVMRHAVDTTRIRTRLKWSPKTTFEEGLRETVEWYRANAWWWRPVKSGEFKGYYDVQYRGLA